MCYGNIAMLDSMANAPDMHVACTWSIRVYKNVNNAIVDFDLPSITLMKCAMLRKKNNPTKFGEKMR